MSKLLYALFFIVTLFSSKNLKAADNNVLDNGYELKFKVQNIKDTVAYLAYYYGNVQLMKDTAEVDGKGNFSFKGNGSLPKGIYLVVLPGKRYFEVIVNEQNFYMETSADERGQYTENMTVKGSVENQVFYDNLKFIAPYNEQLADIREKLNGVAPDSEEAQKLREEGQRITDLLEANRQKVLTENATLFVSKVFRSTDEITIPDAPASLDSIGKRNWQYKYYVNHYFDNLDMSDPGMIRTPIYHNKVSYYIEKFTPQIPDSINAAIDRLLKISTNSEVFKYNIEYLLKTYSKSKLMCMDAVTVHLLSKYFLAGKAPWLDPEGKDSTRFSSMKDYVKKHEQNLCGKKARNIAMADTTGTFRFLHKVDAKYTAVIFWSATCGHCKKALPKIYDSTYVPLKEVPGFFEVYSVCIDQNDAAMKKFNKEHPYSWIIVQGAADHDYRISYDVYSTPVIYLLDEDKNIMFKRLGREQLHDILGKLLKDDEDYNGKIPPELLIEKSSSAASHEGHDH